MIDANDTEIQNWKAVEYLQGLHALAAELEYAMQAIARNRIADLEDSIVNQQLLSSRLEKLISELCMPRQSFDPDDQAQRDFENNLGEIQIASDVLRKLNQRYAALLRHSGRSMALMATLYGSFTGEFKEASGPRLSHPTWSCQM